MGTNSRHYRRRTAKVITSTSDVSRQYKTVAIGTRSMAAGSSG